MLNVSGNVIPWSWMDNAEINITFCKSKITFCSKKLLITKNN